MGQFQQTALKISRDPDWNCRRIVGLTGGIAMGKTTVAQYLTSTHQLPVLDADVYARKAVQPGSPALKAIVERYGEEILLTDGSSDRRRLGNIVFSNPEERLWLEAQIHPYVRDCLQAELHSLAQPPVIVVVIPLLFEANMTDLVTEVWVVRCSQAEQVERLMQRSSPQSAAGHRLTLEQAQARIKSQMPIEQKVAQATVVLDNSSTSEALFRQVDLALGRTGEESVSSSRYT